MIARPLLLAAALLAASATAALAQARDVVAPPTLRANVTVASDIVHIGDLVDNAGSAGAIAVYRAPDLGTRGTLPVAVLAACTHQVIGVVPAT
jgi:flagella basal body P-ring formation protein FlgA